MKTAERERIARKIRELSEQDHMSSPDGCASNCGACERERLEGELKAQGFAECGHNASVCKDGICEEALKREDEVRS